jgi:hypothetical protein
VHRRQSGGGEQQQTKLCHDGLGPRKILGRKSRQESRKAGLATKACQRGAVISKQALGRIVAGFKSRVAFIFDGAKPDAHCSLRIQGIVSDILSHCYLAGYLQPIPTA